MVTDVRSKKAAAVRKLFKPSAESFPAALYPEDNPAARPRRSRRKSPPRCWCRATPLGLAQGQHAGRRVASALP
jgi:hypothetical protein